MASLQITILAGATASGKSELALTLASHTGACIVNADSVQLYRDLAILTAAPNDGDMARAPHHLYRLFEPSIAATAALWLRLLWRLTAENRGPFILVGGTGLYIKAMLYGLAPIPKTDPEIRAEVRMLSTQQSRQALEHEDPIAAAKLVTGDSQRTKRALEIIRSTGRSFVDWQRQPRRRDLPSIDVKGICLLPDRAELRRRIRQRTANMLASGAIEQVAELRQRVGDPLALPIRKTHGLLEICNLLDGAMTADRAIEQTSIKVGQYAKRQSTWFRRQLPELEPVTLFGHEPDALKALERARIHHFA